MSYFKHQLTPKLHFKNPLELAQNLRVGDGLAGFVVLQHGRFLVDLLRQVLLRELKLLSCDLNGLES